MRKKIDAPSAGPRLFLTSANQPTQVAYGLTQADVIDAFITSVLASPVILLAASYYFESSATRGLVARYPRIFGQDNAHVLFFVNEAYPSFTEHGLGKVEKSPRSLRSYTDLGRVRQRGRAMDRLGVVGVRSDIDISDALVAAWLNSCMSSEDGSIRSLVGQRVDSASIDEAVLQCMALADRGSYDFVWNTIAPDVRASRFIAPLSRDLRRKLADLYGGVMSLTLGATETTPATWNEGPGVTRRTIGHLGIFQRLLGHLGISIPRLREEEVSLMRILNLPELELIRGMHSLIIETANEVQEDVLDYWRAVELMERRGLGRRLAPSQVKAALTSSFLALGLSPEEASVRRIVQIEKVMDNRFISHFRSTIEGILSADAGARTNSVGFATQRTAILPKDILVFASADPLSMAGAGAAARLALDREFKRIRRALEDLQDKCRLEVRHEPAFEISDLQSVLLKYNPRFFHFSGHGTSVGQVLLERGDSVDLVRIGPIVRALQLISTNIECVVFNSCFSSSAIRDVGRRIEFAVLMSDAIDDDSALEFSASFYGAVGAGIAVPKAFEIACNALDLGNLPQSDVPRLFRRGKAVKRLP
ncbi:MAG: hypothetical protein QOC72_1383 [Methylobacteriaceae bacterium]|jgi:hypothetical protein|nr:hypothetical protein [Methylobacteriaceae bacterium]